MVTENALDTQESRRSRTGSEKGVDLEKTDVESQKTMEVGDEKGKGKETAEEAVTEVAEDEFPEGGWRAWSVLAGVWIHQFTTFGYTNAYGVYNDYYVREYLADKYTSSQISWIGSTQLLLVLSLGLFSGRGFDTGYFRHLMIGGSLLFVFCLFMLSLTQPGQFYQVYLAQGIGLGAATGISYIPGLALVPHYFRKHRAVALGIASTGSALGGAIHPIYLNNLIHGPVGFHNACRISAGIIGGLLLIGNILMKPRLPPRKAKGNTFHDAKVFLKEPPYVFMTMGTIVIYLGLYFPIFFLQLLAIERGLDRTLAFYSLVILNFASAFGRVIPNRLVPKLGVFNVMIFCVASCTVLIFCFLALENVAGVIIFAVLYGFFSGGYASLLAPMISSVARSDSEIGARMGICFAFTGLGGLIGSPISGALLTSHYEWWRPSLFSAVSVGIGATCFSITRFLISRRKGSQWI